MSEPARGRLVCIFPRRHPDRMGTVCRRLSDVEELDAAGHRPDLTVGTLVVMALQIPIGALVDQVPAKRLLAAVALAAISGSALLLALWPIFSVVLGAKVLHAIASCLAGPVLAAISLGLVGHTLLGSRLGRNVRFLSLGNAIAAGLMGGVAHYYSNQAIFFLTAAFGRRSSRWRKSGLRTSIPNWRAVERANERAARGPIR
jgi:hypothetical protein